MSARWSETEILPGKQHKCIVEKCKKAASYKRSYGKKDGLFHFVIYLCAEHRAARQPL